MALEVFSGDGRNYLLAFPRKVRNKVYQRFMSMATGIADSALQSVAGQRRTANVEQATSLLSNLIGETSVTQRWVVSYLVHLISMKNTFLSQFTFERPQNCIIENQIKNFKFYFYNFRAAIEGLKVFSD